MADLLMDALYRVQVDNMASGVQKGREKSGRLLNKHAWGLVRNLGLSVCGRPFTGWSSPSKPGE